jgi:hypothetical protein
MTPRRWRRRLAPAALLPYLLIVGVAAATVAGLAVRPDVTTADGTAAHVIIVGVPGLRWDDLDRAATPNLWRLAERGAIGALTARSANEPTCAADGWLTLGAGNWAGYTARAAGGSCPSVNVTIEPSGAGGAYLPEQERVVRDNRWQLPWGAVPGALAGAVQCTTAVGTGGALAAARAYGRVDRYVPRLPADPGVLAALFGRCELGIVDLGTVTGEGPARRSAAVVADRALGTVLAARPPDSLLLVAGVADTDADRRLRVVVGHGAGLAGGWLTSPTTRRTGYLQLVDLAPTALAAVGRPPPQVRLAGHPAQHVPARTGDLADGIEQLVAADHEAGVARPLRTWFLLGAAAAQLALLVAILPLLRSPPAVPVPDAPATAASTAGDRRSAVARQWRAVAPALLTVSALVLPAALVADGLPWWRTGPAGGAFTAACLALAAAAAAVVWRWAAPLGTLVVIALCATLAAAAVAADLLTGSRLQLNSVVGYSAHDGGRYAGLGPVGAGLLVAGILVAAGCLAQRVARHWRPAVVVLVGAVGVILAGNPYLGADIGMAVALTAGVCVAAALSTGGWLTLTRLAWAALAGVSVTTGLALADLRRPAELRSGLGRLFSELADGTAGFGLQRVSLANWDSLVHSPMTLVTAGLMAFLWLALLRPWGGLKRLFGIHPPLRAGMVGTAVAATLGGVLTGSALTVAGAAAAVAVPLAALAALRIRPQLTRRAGSRAAVPTSGSDQVLW